VNPPNENATRSWHLATFVGLLILLCVPIFSWALRVAELKDVREMRPLATWPDWEKTKLEKWPAAFESWLGDHFPSRTRIVQWYGLVRHRWLGEPSSLVVVGRDDWLFYTGERTVPDLLGRDRLNETELVNWQQAVEGRRAWWREHGAEYLVVLVPNKSTIYPDRLPAFLRAQAQPGKLDQIVNHLRIHQSPVSVLDLRPALFAAKAKGTVYWPTDSHWNGEGLAAGSAAILTRLREMRVPLRSSDASNWTKIEYLAREGDCIGLLTMNGRWPLVPVSQLRLTFPPDFSAVPTPLSDFPAWKTVGPWGTPLAFERTSGVGRAVMMCDSFFRVGGQPGEVNSQSPLVLSFQRFVSLWSWVSTTNLATYEMVADIAEKEKPTVIIEQWTERYLRTPAPDHPEFQRARTAAAGK
jgi:hypothetical protein